MVYQFLTMKTERGIVHLVLMGPHYSSACHRELCQKEQAKYYTAYTGTTTNKGTIEDLFLAGHSSEGISLFFRKKTKNQAYAGSCHGTN